ncbi:hypothetical protein Fleli_0397 [Bernardetia litoralis DSM 6794]|uniref:Uncharacterized protein n=1 Tax=Bernardetia litoralis (strain ATCC 23117 / DSM 6794 / NBRC 15988 / NCIMB 1366 / Fx l1 / Sio-4) TaxID=880071 RepID=I4AFY9_BERLS|nr:hypothetical protein Fleli_0397 [Bernardetia litoralis DSM 6794]
MSSVAEQQNTNTRQGCRIHSPHLRRRKREQSCERQQGEFIDYNEKGQEYLKLTEKIDANTGFQVKE